jgi:hypothetical protein
LKDNPKVGAIVEAFMPGQAGAEATFQLLLGEASFSGLLPVTVYDADFISRRPITNLDLRGAGGVTYRYFEGEPLWPFGASPVRGWAVLRRLLSRAMLSADVGDARRVWAQLRRLHLQRRRRNHAAHHGGRGGEHAALLQRLGHEFPCSCHGFRRSDARLHRCV